MRKEEDEVASVEDRGDRRDTERPTYHLHPDIWAGLGSARRDAATVGQRARTLVDRVWRGVLRAGGFNHDQPAP